MEYLLSAGVHFGCREQANYRIKDRDGARIFPVYLNIQKPLNLTGSDFGWEHPPTTAYTLKQERILTADETNFTGLTEQDTLQTAWKIVLNETEIREQNAKLNTILADKSFDGIFYSNANEPPDGRKRDAYMIFDSSQIFSAVTGQRLG